MYSVNLVNAHVTTKICKNGPDLGIGPLWSKCITLKGREGVGIGFTSAFTNALDLVLLQITQALAKS